MPRQQGYISEFVGGGRIVSHGQIKDLSEGFKLPGGQLFRSISDRSTAYQHPTRFFP